MSRADEWVRRRCEGETLESIGADYGLTRERIRQVTEKHSPHKPWDAIKAEHRALLAEVEEVRRTTPKADCKTCGAGVFGKKFTYCSDKCRNIRAALRYVVDEQEWKKHRQVMAQYYIEHPEKYEDQVATAKRILKGEPTENHGRWLIEGSQNFEYAKEAVANHWPIAEEFHPDILAQVKEALGPCGDHECDNCDLCQGGECCGEQVLDRALPDQGSWHEPIHGKLGVLATSSDGQNVQCHVCGQWFASLGIHVNKHGMDAAEYRAYFGLAVTRTLDSPKRARRRRAETQPDRTGVTPPNLTSEQRAVITARREQRLETQQSGRHDPEQQRKWGAMRGEISKDERLKLSRLRRKYDPGHECPECGALICTWTYSGGASTKRILCGESGCLSAARSRAAAIANRKRWA